jgi:hypothetical protein
VSAHLGILSNVYPHYIRDAARRAIAADESLSSISRRLGVSRSTLRDWRDSPVPLMRPSDCPVCDGRRLDEPAYSALLGFYFGDGCVSAMARYFMLRISCDARLPGIISDTTRLITRVRPGSKVFHVAAPGAVVVQAHWKHWPCVFPQHGPGRKHERPIVLEGWQREMVERHPGDFLRGLFHSDGCRTKNWATRTVAGSRKRYDYPRWEFVNHSEDILGLCGWALDLCEISWRRPRAVAISVARRDDVRRLDDLIGLKS